MRESFSSLLSLCVSSVSIYLKENRSRDPDAKPLEKTRMAELTDRDREQVVGLKGFILDSMGAEDRLTKAELRRFVGPASAEILEQAVNELRAEGELLVASGLLRRIPLKSRIVRALAATRGEPLEQAELKKRVGLLQHESMKAALAELGEERLVICTIGCGKMEYHLWTPGEEIEW